MKIIDVIINCYKLFYNNYPIIVINGLNIDGDIELVQFFFKYYISIIFIYGAMKISDNLEETIELNIYIIKQKFAEIQNCSSINFSYFTSEKIEMEYNYDNKINISKTFIIKKTKFVQSEIEKQKIYEK